MGWPNDIVHYKDNKVCVLQGGIPLGKKFNIEFSKATSEGYELKGIHPAENLKYVFYFQKFEQFRTRNQTLTPQYHQNLGGPIVNKCKNCGTSYEYPKKCPKCG